MAETELTSLDLKPESILKKFFLEGIFNRENRKSNQDRFFISEGLLKEGEAISSLKSDHENIGSIEMQRLNLSIKIEDDKVILGSIPYDLKRFKESLKTLEGYYIHGDTPSREKILIDLINLGQELLRRRYIGKLLHPEKKIIVSQSFRQIVDFGEQAIKVLSKAPRTPIKRFRKFNHKNSPKTKTTGIEILSSGSFPDWSDRINRELRDSNTIEMGGFENVLDAVFDSPRSRVLAKAIKENKIKSFLALPPYMRTMLDLELMRLGQATTPGTYNMLLNSYYYGAMLVDHSTNVSEQVQIIYNEEEWKPIYKLNDKDSIDTQINNAITNLNDHFLCKKNSPIKRDHPRIARIEFSQDLNIQLIEDFFNNLRISFNKKHKIEFNPKVHQIIPVFRFTNTSERLNTFKIALESLKKTGFNKIALMSDYTKHCPGLMQYFDNATDTNVAIKFSLKNRIKLIDGRTVDMIATTNKAIEAAAGAIMSGHGCVKVGLLGLTYEQMSEFIRKFKRGLGANFKRQNNQLIVFIALVDEPLVNKLKVYTSAKDISNKFIELMKKRGHDILLLDTMHKGDKDKRLVNEKDINKCDTKGGHLTFDELKKLIRKANKKPRQCDLWIAGSYTEAQVYQASLEPPRNRPGLICLGGAERSYGGIRLDPKSAYEISEYSTLPKEKKLSSIIQFDSDIKFLLSRDNKLARDAGLVEGELRRQGNRKAGRLKKLRKDYIKERENYYKLLDEEATKKKLNLKNIDRLIKIGDKINTNQIIKAKHKYSKLREEYVNEVTDEMYKLFAKDWFIVKS